MVSSQGRVVWSALLGSVAALTLAACNGGPASDRAEGTGAHGSDVSRMASYGDERPDPRQEPIPLVNGKPMWAANRLHTAQENAEYHFEHDGSDFGARSVDDFVSKAHAFVDRPPEDVLTLTRANGDRLLYDAHGNVFAVVTKDGAPRTIFKPRTGAAYWDQQKQRTAQSERTNGSDTGGERRDYSRKTSGSASQDDQG